MQPIRMEQNEKICKLLRNLIKELSVNKKKSILAYESDLPRSVVHYSMKGIKGPQLTTFWRLALGFGMRPSELLKMLEGKVGNDYEL